MPLIQTKAFPTPAIIKTLDVSTGHISKSDADLLAASVKDSKSPLIVYDKTGYGWFVFVPSDQGIDEQESNYLEIGLSKAFLNLMRFAEASGCQWIMFDCDGMTYDSLEKFDW